ncbi:PQQ-like beta-propeller repeat protein [bacterium]|nr:PQQ-like beta-propeller repeat protein [bacterium]
MELMVNVQTRPVGASPSMACLLLVCCLLSACQRVPITDSPTSFADYQLRRNNQARFSWPGSPNLKWTAQIGGSNTWGVALDFTAGNRSAIATWDGRVRVLDVDGSELWNHKVGGMYQEGWPVFCDTGLLVNSESRGLVCYTWDGERKVLVDLPIGFENWCGFPSRSADGGMIHIMGPETIKLNNVGQILWRHDFKRLIATGPALVLNDGSSCFTLDNYTTVMLDSHGVEKWSTVIGETTAQSPLTSGGKIYTTRLDGKVAMTTVESGETELLEFSSGSNKAMALVRVEGRDFLICSKMDEASIVVCDLDGDVVRRMATESTCGSLISHIEAPKVLATIGDRIQCLEFFVNSDSAPEFQVLWSLDAKSAEYGVIGLRPDGALIAATGEGQVYCWN